MSEKSLDGLSLEERRNRGRCIAAFLRELLHLEEGAEFARLESLAQEQGLAPASRILRLRPQGTAADRQEPLGILGVEKD